MSHVDAILIPGGGVGPGYSLPPWSEARFDQALAGATGAETFVRLSAATPHLPPPIDSKGFPVRECEAGARYLLARGVPPERVRMEAISLDTVGNAWFAKLLHVDPAGWRRLLVVTSEFHMPRTRTIFETVFGFESSKYQPAFASAENRGPMQAVRKSGRRDRRATPGPGSGYRALIWSLTEARTASTQRAVA